MRQVDIYKANARLGGRLILVGHGKEVPKQAVEEYGPVKFEKTVDLDERGLIGADPLRMGADIDAQGWSTWPMPKE